MVYNEGFDINIGNRSYFAFSKYGKNNHANPEINTRWISKCYSTLVGWYHYGSKKWGCFYATKIGENPEEVTNGEPKGKLLVVANTVKRIDSSRRNRFKSVISSVNNDNQKALNEISGFSQTDETNNVLETMALHVTNFIQTKETVFLNKSFKDHHIFVDRVKNLTDLWEAANYDDFSKMTFEELNKFAGRKKFGKKKGINIEKIFEKNFFPNNKLKEAELFKFKSVRRSRRRDAKYPQFPITHTINKKYMFPARNQVNPNS